MDSEKERKIISGVLDKKIIKEEFIDVEIEKNALEPSFIQDIKSTFSKKGASRSRARISDILLQDNNIKIIFSIISGISSTLVFAKYLEVTTKLGNR